MCVCVSMLIFSLLGVSRSHKMYLGPYVCSCTHTNKRKHGFDLNMNVPFENLG